MNLGEERKFFERRNKDENERNADENSETNRL